MGACLNNSVSNCKKGLTATVEGEPSPGATAGTGSASAARAAALPCEIRWLRILRWCLLWLWLRILRWCWVWLWLRIIRWCGGFPKVRSTIRHAWPPAARIGIDLLLCKRQILFRRDMNVRVIILPWLRGRQVKERVQACVSLNAELSHGERLVSSGIRSGLLGGRFFAFTFLEHRCNCRWQLMLGSNDIALPRSVSSF